MDFVIVNLKIDFPTGGCMKEKGRKIAGALIILAGIVELVIGINEEVVSTILMGLCFCIIGSLYFYEKRK